MSADFVKYDLGQVAAGAIVEITLANRANVYLLDAYNFGRYKRGESFQYVGGEALRSPLRLQVPSTGHWFVTLDLGGGRGAVRSSVRLLEAA